MCYARWACIQKVELTPNLLVARGAPSDWWREGLFSFVILISCKLNQLRVACFDLNL